MENNKIESLLIQILENQTSMKSDISTLSSKVDVIKETTGSHEIDIKILKKIRNNHSL